MRVLYKILFFTVFVFGCVKTGHVGSKFSYTLVRSYCFGFVMFCCECIRPMWILRLSDSLLWNLAREWTTEMRDKIVSYARNGRVSYWRTIYYTFCLSSPIGHYAQQIHFKVYCLLWLSRLLSERNDRICFAAYSLTAVIESMIMVLHKNVCGHKIRIEICACCYSPFIVCSLHFNMFRHLLLSLIVTMSLLKQNPDD